MLRLSYPADGTEEVLYQVAEGLPDAYATREAQTPDGLGLYLVHLRYRYGYDVILPGLYTVLGSSLIRHRPPDAGEIQEVRTDKQRIQAELNRFELFAYKPAHERIA